MNVERAGSPILAFALLATSAFADWPMHRGGPQLRGIAQMPAPAKAVQLWVDRKSVV